MSIVGLGRPDVSIRLKGEARIRTFPGLEEKRGGPRSAPTQTATRHAKEQKLKGYSWEPESPLLPSPLEEPGLPPPPAAAFCCFSLASRIKALRDRRTLLPSMERTLTRTWSPSFSSSRTSLML